MEQRHAQAADVDDVAAVVVGEEIRDAGGPGHPLCLVGLYVHRYFAVLQELAQALDAVPHEVTADMVGVPVGDEHARQAHVVAGEEVDEVAHAVGRIDDNGVAGLPVADQVDEVHHLPGDEVAVGEVAAGEKLAEVQAVAHAEVDGRPGTTGPRYFMPGTNSLPAEERIGSMPMSVPP